MKRSIVIGLDGATFKILDPWLEQGHLPSLSKLIDNGVRGNLRSTIQPCSPVAWTSFMTGKNPGKHGVFDWRERAEESYDLIVTNAHCRKGKTLWNAVTDAGGRACVVNLPVTYPPEKLNGVMVSGMDTPSSASQFTYPPEVSSAFMNEGIDYVIDPRFDLLNKGRVEEWFSFMEGVISNRYRAFRKLYTSSAYDLAVLVFVFSDRVQHAFWRYLDQTHPHFDKEKAFLVEQKILRLFQKFDECLADVMSLAGDETGIFVVSDHGFTALRKNIYVNKFLEDRGFLKRKSGVFNRLRRQKDKINWKKTRVYSHGYHGNIFVNLKGREPNGIVEPGSAYDKVREQVIQALSEMRNPETKVPIVEKIYRKEDVYSGEFLDRAPDILFQTRGMEYRVNDGFFYNDKLPQGDYLVDPPLGSDGIHDMDGIFIASGSGIEKNKTVTSAAIVDVMPSVLAFMGVPIPPDVDGKVLQRIFEDEKSRENLTVSVSSKEQKEAKSKRNPYTLREQKQKEERLKRLGYIG